MRQQILEAIATTLKPLDFVVAMWQGGSEAHGYTDEWSDLDIVVIVRDEYVEETFESVEKAIVAIAPIEFEWRIPEPTWHGHSQCFWRLQGTNPYLLIDFAVMKLSSSNRFLEL
ncbi:MAG: nucleotidyltransferase domain-containing protein, partial [Xenococcaceae cyanobacterium]